MLFAYFGPDAVLPVTSTIAATVGFGLMFGRQIGRFVSLAFRRIIGPWR